MRDTCVRVCMCVHVPNAQHEGLWPTAEVRFQKRERERKLHDIGRGGMKEMTSTS